MMIKQFHLRHQIFSPKDRSILSASEKWQWFYKRGGSWNYNGFLQRCWKAQMPKQDQAKTDSAQDYMNQPDSPVCRGQTDGRKERKKTAGQGYLNCIWTHLPSVWHSPCVTHKSGTCTSPEECCNIGLWQDIHSWHGHFSKLSAF